MSDKESVPTILFRFKHGPQLFRVVITAPYGGVVIERQERDGMGDPSRQRRKAIRLGARVFSCFRRALYRHSYQRRQSGRLEVTWD